MAGPGVRGRMRKQIDLVKVESYAFHNLSINEICVLLGVSKETFYKRAKTQPIMEAVERGRAKRTLDLTQKLFAKTAVKESDWRCLIAALEKTGDRWKDKPLVETHINGTNISVESVLPEDAQIRAAAAFLRSRGYDIEAEQ